MRLIPLILLVASTCLAQMNFTDLALLGQRKSVVPPTPTYPGLLDGMEGYWSMEQASNADAPPSNLPADRILTHTGTTTQNASGIRGNCNYPGTGFFVDGNGWSVFSWFGSPYSFSIAMWVYSPAGNYTGTLVSEWNPADTTEQKFKVTSSAGITSLTWWDSVTYGTVTSTVTLTAGKWHLVTCGWANEIANYHIWIQVDNETRVTQLWSNGDGQPAGAKLTFNALYTEPNGSSFGSGYIDECAVWRARILSTDDVSWLWNSGYGYFYADWVP